MIQKPKQAPVYSFTERDALCVLVIRDMRRSGFSVPQAADAARWLATKSMAAIEQAILADRRYLLFVGDSRPFPRPLTEAEIFENRHLPLAEAIKFNVPIAAIDLGKHCAAIKRHIASRGKAAPKANTPLDGGTYQLDSRPVESGKPPTSRELKREARTQRAGA